MKVLEIVTGLVLIYFLYSLLVSIIGEMISSWTGMRARTLRQGIGNLLNDSTIRKISLKNLFDDLMEWILEGFLIEPRGFKFTVAGRFYKRPEIRNLARVSDKRCSIRKTKPSYISKSHFSGVILNMLQEKGLGVNKWDRIVFAVEKNALHLDPETWKQYKALLASANGKYQLFVEGLESHYDEMMGRLNGWYKRKIGLVLFWIGFVVCAAMNVDTFQIVGKLSTDPKTREEMMNYSEAIVKDTSAYAKMIATREDSLRTYEFIQANYDKVWSDLKNAESILANRWEFENQDRIISYETVIDQKDIVFLLHKVDSLNKKANNVRTLKTADSLGLPEHLKNKQPLSNIDNGLADVLSKINAMKGIRPNRIVAIDSIKYDNKTFQATVTPSVWQKIHYVLRQVYPTKIKFWGIFITALALSLGANFWFDLLKKLVSLRSAGVKPEEKKDMISGAQEKSRIDNDGLYEDSLDPVERVISENRKYWEGLPGVLGINKSEKHNTIEIISEDTKTIRKLIGESIYTNDLSNKIDIDHLSGEKAKFLNNQRGYIYVTDKDIRGSIAGIFENKKTGKSCYLTCAHVVQKFDSGHFDIHNSEVRIMEGGRVIGKISNLIRSSFIDAAVIDSNDYHISGYDIANIGKIRSISNLSHQQKQNIFFKSSGEKDPVAGKLAMSRFNYTFENNTYMYDMFLVEHGTEKHSAGGDSGALLYVREEHDKGEGENNIAIGILIGSARIKSRRYSLGIKLDEVCDALQINPVHTPKK